MKKYFYVLFISLTVGFSAQSSMAAAPPEIQNEANNSFIFQFSPSVAVSEAPELAASLTRAHNGILRHVFTHALKGFSADMARADAISLVNDSSEVTRFMNNGVGHVPGDTGKAEGAKGGKGKPQPNSDGQKVSWGVAVVGNSHDATSDGITRHAWIIDTGIDDYYQGIELNIGEGVNLVAKGKDTIDDTNGHGTHIAGILAAIDNDTGVLGIAAGATVHPVRVLHNNLWGTVDAIIAGVDYAAGKIQNDYPGDKHVINMSLTVGIAGQEEAAAMLDSAIATVANAGVNFAVCAGNDGTDASLYAPANLLISNVYTVASIDEAGNLASDSNYGPEIDFVAPGVAIESLKPGGGTWFWSGCSMATPHVAGILLFQTPIGHATNTGYDLASF